MEHVRFFKSSRPINNYIKGDQEKVSAALLANKNLAVVWHSFGQDGSGRGIYGQVLNSSGQQLSEEFLINTYVSNEQSNPEVTTLSNGNFIVSWQSFGQDGAGYGIYMQKFDFNGNKIGGEIQVNSYTKNDQSEPTITSLDDSGFIISWQSFGQDESGYGIYAQKFDGKMRKVGDEIRINSNDKYYQINPAVTHYDDIYEVVWQSWNQSRSGYELYSSKIIASSENDAQIVNVNNTNLNFQDPTIIDLEGGGTAVFMSASEFNKGNDIYGVNIISNNPASPTVSFTITPSLSSTVTSLPTIAASKANTSTPSSHVSVTTTPSVTNTATVSSTTTMIVTPFSSPSSIMYTNVVVGNLANYTGSDTNEAFVIDADNLIISGGGGIDKFIITPRLDGHVRIIDFSLDEVIDFSGFSQISSYSNLNITQGSTVVTLPGNQVVTIANHYPSEIHANNFIFSPSSTPASASSSTSESNLPLIIGVAVGSAVGLALASVGIYAIWKVCHKLPSPFLTAAGTVASNMAGGGMTGGHNGHFEGENPMPKLAGDVVDHQDIGVGV